MQVVLLCVPVPQPLRNQNCRVFAFCQPVGCSLSLRDLQDPVRTSDAPPGDWREDSSPPGVWEMDPFWGLCGPWVLKQGCRESEEEGVLSTWARELTSMLEAVTFRERLKGLCCLRYQNRTGDITWLQVKRKYHMLKGRKQSSERHNQKWLDAESKFSYRIGSFWTMGVMSHWD